MKDLACLAQAISRQRLRKVDFLGAEVLGGRSTKLRDLYDGLVEGTIRSDRDGARLLYGAGPGDARWRQLKSRFRRKLLNTLMLVDLAADAASDYEAEQTTAQRDLAQLLLLRQAGATEAAADGARALLGQTDCHARPALVLACANLLAAHTPASTTGSTATSTAGQLAARREYAQQALRAAEIQRASAEAQVIAIEVAALIADDMTSAHSGRREVTPLLRLAARIDRLGADSAATPLLYTRAETWVAIGRYRRHPDLIVAAVVPLLALARESSQSFIADRIRPLALECAVAHAACGNWDACESLLRDPLAGASPGYGTASSLACAALLARLACDHGHARVAYELALAVLSSPGATRLAARELEGWYIRLALARALDDPHEASDDGRLSLKTQRALRRLGRQQRPHASDDPLAAWWSLLARIATTVSMGAGATATTEALIDLRAYTVTHLAPRRHVQARALSRILYRWERAGFAGDPSGIAPKAMAVLSDGGLDLMPRPDDHAPCSYLTALAACGVRICALAA